MSTEDQTPATSGSVANAFGNALAWKWSRQMPTALRRGFLTLLYALRAMANASGELAFHGDRQPIRIQDIAKAAGANEKNTRRYLDAAIRAGVVVVKGERKQGRPTLYVLLLSPFPDWQAAEDYLKSTAPKPGKGPAPWVGDDQSSGPRDPNQFGLPRPELTDSKAEEVRVPATRMGSGPRDPNGSGPRDPNNPWVNQESSHDGAEVVDQPQVDRASRPQDHSPQEHPERPPAAPAPAATAGRCRECEIPLIRPGRDLCAGCEQYLATTDRERHTA